MTRRRIYGRRRVANANEPLAEKIARRAITTTVEICCLPCICCMCAWFLGKGAKDYVQNYESPRAQREIKERKLSSQLPRTLQTRGENGLERCLTIGRMTYQNGSDAGAQVEVTGMGRDVEAIGMRGRTDPQEQSFFFKLPEEIRRQIYGEIISGYTFHIRYIEAYRRMGHTRCRTKLPNTCKCLYYVRKKGVPDEWGQADLLAPLQACRRMYCTVSSPAMNELPLILRIGIVKESRCCTEITFSISSPWQQCSSSLSQYFRRECK
jgi:hypothetical protein